MNTFKSSSIIVISIFLVVCLYSHVLADSPVVQKAIKPTMKVQPKTK